MSQVFFNPELERKSSYSNSMSRKQSSKIGITNKTTDKGKTNPFTKPMSD